MSEFDLTYKFQCGDIEGHRSIDCTGGRRLISRTNIEEGKYLAKELKLEDKCINCPKREKPITNYSVIETPMKGSKTIISNALVQVSDEYCHGELIEHPYPLTITVFKDGKDQIGTFHGIGYDDDDMVNRPIYKVEDGDLIIRPELVVRSDEFVYEYRIVTYYDDEYIEDTPMLYRYDAKDVVLEKFDDILSIEDMDELKKQLRRLRGEFFRMHVEGEDEDDDY